MHFDKLIIITYHCNSAGAIVRVAGRQDDKGRIVPISLISAL
jgi:hypothetical protein